MIEVKGYNFDNGDYHAPLGDFDMIDAVVALGVDRDTAFYLDIVFTDGMAYVDIPDFGRMVFPCDTDKEWMDKYEPTEFDIYGDIEKCGFNRWMIWYITQRMNENYFIPIVK